MRVVHLIDNKRFVNDVANWIYNEFVDGIRSDIDVKYIENALKTRKKSGVPITLIAIENDECVGTVTLYKNDLKTLDLTPWLGSLYVNKEHRGRGIAKKLIKELSNMAKSLEYKTLYLRTEHTSNYYKKLGWEFVVKTKDELGIETEVYKIDLIN